MTDTATFDYDLFVIGGGSGGVRAARIAATLGARVGLCEERYMGGTCVNVGCVPKKLLVYGSQYSHHIQDAEGFGWTVPESSFDWGTLIARKDKEIGRLNGIYDRLLDRAGVTVINGHGRLTGPNEVDVDGTRVTAARILIATGSWPWIPPIPGREHGITSNEIFALETLPERIVIVGGGYIGVEFAGILAGMGVQVTQVHRDDVLLRGFDHDLQHALGEEMDKAGVNLVFNAIVDAIERRDDGALRVCIKGDQSGYHSHFDDDWVETDCVLFATGRRPLTEGLGLEDVGVALDDWGAIVVNDQFQTSVPSVYALGDVTGGLTLTPVALAEGMYLARLFFSDTEPTPIDYNTIPTAVFSQPNLATVGMTEAQAVKAHGEDDLLVFKSVFRPMKHTLSGRDTRMVMKLIVHEPTDRVLGCHMLGDDAGEIIQGLAVALKCGATKAQFDATIGIHPTAAEEFVTMRTPMPKTPKSPTC